MRADLLAFVFQFHLAGHRGDRRVNVGNARPDHFFASQQRAAFSVGNNRFHHRNWQPLRDPGMFVDALIFARFKCDLFDCFANKIGNQQAILETVARGPGFLSRDLDTQADLFRIMRHDFGANAVFERRDDLAARGVIFGIR